MRHLNAKVSNVTVPLEVCTEKEEADLSPDPVPAPLCDTQLGCGLFTAIPC